MGVIQDLRDEKVLVLFHDYRNNQAVDDASYEHDMTDHAGTLTDTVWDGRGLTFPESTSVVDVDDSDDIQMDGGCLVAYFGQEITAQPTGDEYLVSKRDGGGTNYQWLATTTGCSFYDGSNTRTVAATLTHVKTLAVNFDDGTTPELFGDGVTLGSFNGTVAITKNDAPLEIGNYNDANPVQSTLQAVLIVNRELTADEHLALHNELEDRFEETRWTDAQDRILSQFQDSPKLKSLVETIFNRVDNVDYVLRYLEDYTDIDTACGVWLDVVGDIVGIPRPHIEQSYGTMFAFKERSVPGTVWEGGTTPTNNDWYGICYGGNQWVSVSASGTGDRVMTSPDGLTWSTQTSAADLSWRSVCYSYDLGLYVAVASSGTGNRVMSSQDGITWTSRASAADVQWFRVVRSDAVGLFVAVARTGTGNRIMSSPDGITWTTRVNPVDNGWRGLRWSDAVGLFVAVSENGTNDRVMTSSDGITWTTRVPAANKNWYGVTYGNGLFVAVGGGAGTELVMTSPDGITWTTRDAPNSNTWRSVTWTGERFVATSTDGSVDRVMTSANGIDWEERVNIGEYYWIDIAHDGAGQVAAVAYSGSTDRVMTSDGSMFIDDPYKAFV